MNKTLLYISGVLCLVVVGFVIVQQAKPQGFPGKPAIQAPSPKPTSNSARPQAAAQEPTITWSVPQLSQTMFPGTSSTTTVSFRSSQNLTGVAVDVTPSLQDIVAVQPTSFLSITAGQDYKLILTLSAPREFTKRSFGGTIQLRGSSTPPKVYAPPLEANLQTDWGILLGTGFALNYPSGWSTQSYENTFTLSSTTTTPVLEGDPGNEIQITVLPLSGAGSISAWLKIQYNGLIDFSTQPLSYYTNSAGIQFVLLGSVPSSSSDNISAFASLGGNIVQISVDPASVFMGTFNSILSSFRYN